jgi:hypothetical protein
MWKKCMIAAAMSGCLWAGSARATLIYQWNFASGSGAPQTGTGGTLSATSPGAFTGAGVSGASTDKAYTNAT